MATMLAYIVTDLNLGKEFLDASLRAAVKTSFNTISVDGDQSTSDTGIQHDYWLLLKWL